MRRRSQRTRRTRRMRITQLVIFSLLGITLLSIGALALRELIEPVEEPGVIAPKTFADAPAEVTCPEDGAVPAPPGEVEVRVLNGTGRSGLAGSVSEELGARGFATGELGNSDDASRAATIVHGPDGYLSARSLAAHVGEAELQLDEREGTGVDLLLGQGWSGIAEAPAAEAAMAEPVPVPEGCG